MFIITVTSNDRHGVSDYRSIECLFNSLLLLTTMKQQSSALLSLCAGYHRRLVESPHKGIVTRKMLPFDDVIMSSSHCGPPTIGHLIRFHWTETYCGFFPCSLLNGVIMHIWGLWCQKQVYLMQTGMSNCIPQNTVGCNYLSWSEIPASGAKVLIYIHMYIYIYVYAPCRLPKHSCIMCSNNYVHWMVATSPLHSLCGMPSYCMGRGLVYLWPLLLTWIGFNPSMDK